MILPIESAILELKSGLKLEFKDDKTVKVLRISTTESKVRIETKYNSFEASFIAQNGFRILTNVESIKSLTFNYK